jgi:hypothetical protein
MSAGGISYSGIVNYGKVTLPSVEAGLGSMNMLRDPPKSYHTRRIDKVGETSSITEMIDGSSNRACEAIQVYARGVNPSVSVSYSNEGNNGGQRSSGLKTGGQVAAYLPYTTIRDGAFRPPVLYQEDVLPLSRLPRVWTSAFSKPGFADFSRKMRVCGTAANTKEVHTDVLKACVRPTAVYQIETPLVEPFEVKNVIQPLLRTSATSGVRSMDVTQRMNADPTKEIDYNPLHAHAHANYTSTKHVNNNHVDPNRYLQDIRGSAVLSNISSSKHDTGTVEIDALPYLQDANVHPVVSNASSARRGNNDQNELDPMPYLQSVNPSAVVSNVSSNKHQTPIDQVLDLADIPVHLQINNISALAPISGVEQTKYFHDDLELSRTLPEYQTATNIGDATVYKHMTADNEIQLERNMPVCSFTSNPVRHGSSDHGSRTVRLLPKIAPGSFSVPGTIPSRDRMQDVHMRDSEKSKMNRAVSDSIHERFAHPAPFDNKFGRSF